MRKHPSMHDTSLRRDDPEECEDDDDDDEGDTIGVVSDSAALCKGRETLDQVLLI